jgi:hypothetical protein
MPHQRRDPKWLTDMKLDLIKKYKKKMKRNPTDAEMDALLTDILPHGLRQHATGPGGNPFDFGKARELNNAAEIAKPLNDIKDYNRNLGIIQALQEQGRPAPQMPGLGMGILH